MDRKILVAGGGHGGIAAGALLAKNGYDVTVFEKNEEDTIGHDWTDIFDKRGFLVCGMGMPSEDKYCLKNNMTFYPPSMSRGITQQTEYDKLEIQMERRDIYSHIISYAKGCGVKFEFGTEVISPVFCGSRVIGINTSKGTYYGNLVIDACGIDSPLRNAMPYYTGIQKSPRKYEHFYVYRAFYERTAPVPENNFKVILLHNNILGISWVATEEEHTDILIGRFEPFGMEEVETELASLRKSEPSLGEKKLRGGQFVQIPVRQPLGVLVADGYAAIGDSAFMTVPLIGSGIANSLKAAAILADAVQKDVNNEYSAVSLWNYQKSFYRELGAGLAPIACLKLILTKISADDVEYVFDKGLLTGAELTMDCDSNSLIAFAKHLEPKTFLNKGISLSKRPSLLSKVLWCGKKLTEAVAVCAAMPSSYDRDRVLKWVSEYNKVFEVG